VIRYDGGTFVFGTSASGVLFATPNVHATDISW
jgi:hypothetical protein